MTDRFDTAQIRAQSQSHRERAFRSDLATAARLLGHCGAWDGVLASKHYDHAQASPVLAGFVERAATGMTLDDLTDSIPYQAVITAFTQSLVQQSPFDAMKAAMRATPLRSRMIAMSADSDALDGDDTSESEYVPLSSFTVEADALTPRKAMALVALSREAWGYSGTTPFVDAELRAGIARSTNRRFLAELALVAATTPSSGGTAANVLADIDDMLNEIALGASSRPYLIIDAGQCKRLAMLHSSGIKTFPDLDVGGGSIAGIPVVISDQLPSDTAGSRPVLVDADALLYDDRTIELSVARHASIRMTETSGQTGAADLVSLWQTGSRGVRAVRHWSAHVHRASAVVVLTGCGW